MILQGKNLFPMFLFPSGLMVYVFFHEICEFVKIKSNLVSELNLLIHPNVDLILWVTFANRLG